MSGARVYRGVGWLAASALVAAAFLVPAGAVANEGNPPPVECEGYELWLKIDNVGKIGVVAGTYEMGDPNVDSNWAGQAITLADVSTDGQSFDWAAALAVGKVVVKGGDGTMDYPGGMSGSVAWDAPPAISHVTWCGNPPEIPSEPPSVSPSVSPEGSVQAETGTPVATLPPTDTFSAGGPSDGTWRLFLLGMAGILAAILVMVPAETRRR